MANENFNTNRELIVFFDTPELSILKNDGYLKYVAKEYKTKKNKLKYTETIELKYNTIHRSIPVKQYNNIKMIEGKHALFSLVKREFRNEFKNILQQSGIKYPMRIKLIYRVSKIKNTYDLFFRNNKIDTFTKNLNDENNEYVTIYKYLKSKVNFLSLKLSYPNILNLLSALLTGLMGLIIIKLLFNKRLGV